MVYARDVYTTAREADASRLTAATEAARALVSQVEKAAARFGCGFDDIAAPVNVRANEIKEERAQELEKERDRDRGLSDGLGL